MCPSILSTVKEAEAFLMFYICYRYCQLDKILSFNRNGSGDKTGFDSVSPHLKLSGQLLSCKLLSPIYPIIQGWRSIQDRTLPSLTLVRPFPLSVS